MLGSSVGFHRVYKRNSLESRLRKRLMSMKKMVYNDRIRSMTASCGLGNMRLNASMRYDVITRALIVVIPKRLDERAADG